MSSFKFTIDEIPPSLNKYLGNSHSYKIYGAEKVRWSWLVLAAIGDRAPIKPFEKAEVQFKCYFRNRVHRDLDNICVKWILDPLVKLGVIKDDNFLVITKITITAEIDKERPRTEVMLVLD